MDSEQERWFTLSVATHRAPTDDPDAFPLIDNRDESETWIWLNVDAYVSVSRTMAQEILESFSQ